VIASEGRNQAPKIRPRFSRESDSVGTRKAWSCGSCGKVTLAGFFPPKVAPVCNGHVESNSENSLGLSKYFHTWPCSTPIPTVCKVGCGSGSLAGNRILCLNLTFTPLIELFLIETRNVVYCDVQTLIMVNIRRNIIEKLLKIYEQNSSILKFGLILKSYRYSDQIVGSITPFYFSTS